MAAQGWREAHTDAIVQQVARVLNHRSFSRSHCPARILRALGERLMLVGPKPATQLEIARVLDLPLDFDPGHNPLVRIHMCKLRRMLASYASGDGKHDMVTLVIPRNAYRLEGLIKEAGVATRGESRSARLAANAQGRVVMLVTEFAAAAEDLQKLTRYLALWLVPQLLSSERIAAIGPILRDEHDSAGDALTTFLQRGCCNFFIEGDCRHGGRGVEIIVRIVDVTNGRVCWTDWLDEPSANAADGYELVAKMIAARIAGKIMREGSWDGSLPETSDLASTMSGEIRLGQA